MTPVRLRLVAAVTLVAGAVVALAGDAHAEYVVRKPWAHLMDRPGPEQKAAGEPPRRIIYLSREGGTYTRGDHDDSSLNLSSFIEPGSHYLNPWSIDELTWTEVLVCSRLMFGRFDVEVTDVDPGDVPHLEAALGGKPGDLGLAGGIGGISPFDCSVPVIERSITFIFTDSLGGNSQRVCEVIAQEIAHSVGLDHELLCEDPMTYLGGCGSKTFHDVYADCHDMQLSKAPCACSGAEKQNSVQMLYERLGAAETESPAVSIQAPADGTTVRPQFAIDVTATDNYYVTKVDLWIDGVFKTGLGASPTGVMAPTDIPVGQHTIELRAYDPGGNFGSASVTVTLEAECAAASECGSSEICQNGLCLGDVGAECGAAEDCVSGTCALDDEIGKFCSRECGAGNRCPSGFTCTREGLSPVDRCYPGGGDDGCSLGVGGSPGAGAGAMGAGFVAFLALLAARARRRGR